MNIVKKFSIGAWIALVTAVLALVSVIVYTVNISGAGYFQNASVGNMTVFCLLAVVMLAAAIALGQVKLDGTAATAVDLVSGVLQIAAPVLLVLCLANLVAARAEGLGFIYFSNADVILEVQTPANLASATGTIANMVCLGVAAVAGMVGAFFNLRKKA
ncbi:MAG: hypothetical protein K2K53_05260 [Oscillospiraceae bacterium]|nr:hypothetical protein [Oscillospiraceae bacterium]